MEAIKTIPSKQWVSDGFEQTVPGSGQPAEDIDADKARTITSLETQF
jgi:hypothetical protein